VLQILQMDPESKARLQQKGQLRPCRDRQRELQAAGYSSGEALSQALAEFLNQRKKVSAPLLAAPSREGLGASPGTDDTPGPVSSIDPADFAGKPPANHRESMNWVFENLEVPIQLLDTGDCPSKGAWGMLMNIQEHPTELKKEFLKNILPKLMPSKKEVDALNRKVDQGQILPYLDSIDKETYLRLVT